MQKHEKLSEGEELLAEVLEECLEEDLSFVPPEREISRKHRFSEDFEQAMERLQEEISDELRKKEIRRHFSPRYGQWAACILVFCACGWLLARVGGQIGGSGMEKSADMAEAPAEESAVEEAAAEDMDSGAGSSTAEEPENADMEERILETEESKETKEQEGKNYCEQMVYPAGDQEVPERLENLTTLVNCPVLDEDNPVLMLTIGNMGEEEVRYLDRCELEVWLEDAWYRIPSESEQEGEWHILEAGMAVDEEIDLSEYQIDYDASQYRLVTHTGQGPLSVEFTFAEVFEKTMEESESF